MKIKKIFEIGLINTFRLNFHYYPLKQAIKFPIIASRHLRIRQLEGKITHLQQKTASVRLGFDTLGIFDNKKSRSIWEVSRNSEIVIKDRIAFGNGFKLSMNGGRLLIGSNLIITGNSTIICCKRIEFGDNDLISWDVLIMDTDFHKIYSDGCLTNTNKKITIKDNVWIGCRNTILKGSVIPEGSVIAAGSILTQELKMPNCIYGGIPIKVLKSNINWES
ncbi:MAG: acyltransferase [Muribaculaceae bacterium]|nr:acyltransferase [Muribaculaceae bacterium]